MTNVQQILVVKFYGKIKQPYKANYHQHDIKNTVIGVLNAKASQNTVNVITVPSILQEETIQITDQSVITRNELKTPNTWLKPPSTKILIQKPPQSCSANFVRNRVNLISINKSIRESLKNLLTYPVTEVPLNYYPPQPHR